MDGICVNVGVVECGCGYDFYKCLGVGVWVYVCGCVGG